MSEPEIPQTGRVMAIDLGEKRIGIALSDSLRLLAKGHTIIKRQSRREDFARYQQIIEQQTIICFFQIFIK